MSARKLSKRQRSIAKREKRRPARERRKNRERREYNAEVRRIRRGDLTFEEFKAQLEANHAT